jgi:peptidylprolyl isomerase domain and WD repeat-containing protein 1
MFQGIPKADSQRMSEEKFKKEISHAVAETKPMLFAAAFKKPRFYVFTRAEPDEEASEGRDVFNEKPTREEAVEVAEMTMGAAALGRQATIRTSLGDIVCKLFPDECPRTIENFSGHSRKGYYNGLIFHRVIKSFMVQTGDPLGDGTGGESIWGGEFEDEFHRNLRFDRPFVLGMANAGVCVCGWEGWGWRVVVLPLAYARPCAYADSPRPASPTVRPGHQRVSVFHHHCCLPMARQQAHCLWSRRQRHGRCRCD